jgi:hypothetical protein
MAPTYQQTEEISLGIYYRKYKSPNWIDVTYHIAPDTEITWEEFIKNQYPEFSINLNAPTDSYPGNGNKLMLDNGDEMCITEDKTRTKIVDYTLAGIITYNKVTRIFDVESPAADIYTFETKSQAKPWSKGIVDLKAVRDKFGPTMLLSDLLRNHIFTNEKTTGLGGIKQNGEIIFKFNLPASLDKVVPIPAIKGEAASIVNTLCSGLAYDTRLEYTPEPLPAPVNLNLFRTVRFFNKTTGYPNISTRWKNGINRQTVADGVMLNPDYDPINKPNEPKYILAETKIEYEKDSAGMANYTKFLSYVFASNNQLTRKEFTTGEGQNKFEVGRCMDIAYIAREVECLNSAGDIETVIDDKNITIDLDKSDEIGFDADRVADNGLGTKLVAEIDYDGDTFHRTFTIAGQAVTLTGGTAQYPSDDGSIPGLSSGTIALLTRFSLINGYDKVKPNSIKPGDGNGYAIINVALNSENSFELTGYDAPDILSPGDKIVAYVYEVTEDPKFIKHLEQIERYGQYYTEFQIPNPVTTEEYKKIIEENSEKKEPLETVTIYTFREGEIPQGSRLFIDMDEMISKTVLVSSVQSTAVAGKSPYNNKTLTYRIIKCHSYLDDMPLFLAESQLRSDIADSLLEDFEHNNYTMTHEHIITCDIGVLPPADFIAAPHALLPLFITDSSFKAECTHVYNANLGYKLYVSADNFSTFVPGYNGLLVSDPSVTVTGLSPATIYKYKWKASSSDGDSAFSNAVEAETVGAVEFDTSDLTDFRYINYSEGTGSTAGSIDGSSAVGTLTGGAAWSTELGTYNNYSVDFDGSGRYITVPHDTYIPKGSSSIFVYQDIVTTSSLSTLQELCTSYNDSSTADGINDSSFAIFITAAGKLTCNFYNNATNGTLVSTTNSTLAELGVTVNNPFFVGICLNCVTDTLEIVINGTDASYTLDTSGTNAASINAFGGMNSSANNPLYLGNAFGYTTTLYQRGKKYRTLVSAGVTRTATKFKEEAAKFGLVPSYPVSGLLARYDMDGNANDSSGNGYTATLGGSASAASKRLVLGNNATDYLSIPATMVNGLTDFSITAWVQISTKHSGAGWNQFISMANASRDNEFALSYSESSAKWGINYRNGADQYFTGSTVNTSWHHIGLTRSGATVKLYIDGAYINSVSLTGSTTLLVDTNGFVIGQDQDSVGGGFVSTQSLAGNVDELLIYNRELTGSEVLEIYNNPHS